MQQIRCQELPNEALVLQREQEYALVGINGVDYGRHHPVADQLVGGSALVPRRVQRGQKPV